MNVALGHSKIGAFQIHVHSWTPDAIPKEDDTFEVLIAERKEDGLLYIVNLVKHPLFKDLFALNQNNFPTKDTNIVEYNSYFERKHMEHPPWKLTRKTVEKMFIRINASS